MRHLGINPSLKIPTLRNFCNTLNALSDALVLAKLSENFKFQHPTKTMEKPSPWTYKKCIKKRRLCQTTSFWVSRCFKMSWRNRKINSCMSSHIPCDHPVHWNIHGNCLKLLRKNLWQSRISRGIAGSNPPNSRFIACQSQTHWYSITVVSFPETQRVHLWNHQLQHWLDQVWSSRLVSMSFFNELAKKQILTNIYVECMSGYRLVIYVPEKMSFDLRPFHRITDITETIPPRVQLYSLMMFDVHMSGMLFLAKSWFSKPGRPAKDPRSPT